MHVVEVPGVGVLVGQHAPAVLARHAAAAGVGGPHVLGQSTPALTDLVTNITNTISGEKIVMRKNFSFPCMTIVWKLKTFRCHHMTDVEKSKILKI